MSNNRGLLYQVLEEALRGTNVIQQDPVSNVYTSGINTFDHESIFQFLELPGFNQGNINRDNIQSAATLYAIMVLGDEMGIYRTTDIVLKYFTQGRLDVASSTTATRIYNYFQKKDDRTQLPERMMFYQQVFGLQNDQKAMEEVVYNQSFGSLWETLMYEVIRYIKKYERAEVPENVSKSSINQVILDLQSNLSRAASGMVKIFIPEMYAHLEDAIQILNAQEIKDQIGHGVARDIWNVIESINQEEFGYFPNTSALRTIAANARQIILDVAAYEAATFDDVAFEKFVRNVEGFIVAKSQLEGNQTHLLNGEKSGDEVAIEEEIETMDEDWDF